MKKIALLILIFTSLGFCEFSLEDKVNDIVKRAENCKVFNKKKTLSNPNSKGLKNALRKFTKPGFINSSSIVSFKCNDGSVRGEFFLVQNGNSIVFDFIGYDDLKEGIIQFSLAGLNKFDLKEGKDGEDFVYGFYRIFDENDIETEMHQTDDDEPFEALKTTVMDSYKILKGAVK